MIWYSKYVHGNHNKQFIDSNSLEVFVKRTPFDHKLDKFLSTSKNSSLTYLRGRTNVQHDPIREYFALLILQKLLDNNICDSIPKLYLFSTGENVCCIEMEQATMGSLHHYFDFDNDETIYHPFLFKDEKLITLKLSITVRLLIALYSINEICGIAHNDLHSENVILTHCNYSVARIKYFDENKGAVQVLEIPTFGIRPIICDFGKATTYDTPHVLDDYSRMMSFIDGRHPYQRREHRTVPSTILAQAVEYYHRLSYLINDDVSYCANDIFEFDVSKTNHCFCIIS